MAALKAWAICSAIDLESATLSSFFEVLVEFDLEEEEDFYRLALVFIRIDGSVAVKSCEFGVGSILFGGALDEVACFAEVISMS